MTVSTPKPLVSECCWAEMEVDAGLEGTNFYYCSNCGQACNPSVTNEAPKATYSTKSLNSKSPWVDGKEPEVIPFETNETHYLKEFDEKKFRDRWWWVDEKNYKELITTVKSSIERARREEREKIWQWILDNPTALDTKSVTAMRKLLSREDL